MVLLYLVGIVIIGIMSTQRQQINSENYFLA